jgi:hypothetical protein
MAQQLADRVKETTTTTGTGALTLAGAMTGFRAFSSICSVGDTCYYALQSVDSNGNPTGAWEVGLGTYSSASTLTRTTILASSTGSVISLAAGTTQVWMDLPAALFPLGTIVLPYICAQDQKSSGTGGGVAVAASQQVRTLNTVVANTIPGASLSSNAIALPAGTYRIQASAPGWNTSFHQASLYNSTTSTYLLIGTSESSAAGNYATNRSIVAGQFTLSGAASVVINHYITNAGLNSLGAPVASGNINVFTEVQITKVA